MVTDEEMEHYLWFPELYCARHEGGSGPLCEECLEKQLEDDEISREMRDSLDTDESFC